MEVLRNNPNKTKQNRAPRPIMAIILDYYWLPRLLDRLWQPRRLLGRLLADHGCHVGCSADCGCHVGCSADIWLSVLTNATPAPRHFSFSFIPRRAAAHCHPSRFGADSMQPLSVAWYLPGLAWKDMLSKRVDIAARYCSTGSRRRRMMSVAKLRVVNCVA